MGRPRGSKSGYTMSPEAREARKKGGHARAADQELIMGSGIGRFKGVKAAVEAALTGDPLKEAMRPLVEAQIDAALHEVRELRKEGIVWTRKTTTTAGKVQERKEINPRFQVVKDLWGVTADLLRDAVNEKTADAWQELLERTRREIERE